MSKLFLGLFFLYFIPDSIHFVSSSRLPPTECLVCQSYVTCAFDKSSLPHCSNGSPCTKKQQDSCKVILGHSSIGKCDRPGLFPDLKSPEKYYRCWIPSGSTTISKQHKICPNNTTFHSDSLLCLNEEEKKTVTMIQNSTPAQNSKTIRNSCKASGFYRYPYDCKNYYFCDYDLQPKTYSCSFGTYFDYAKKKCTSELTPYCKSQLNKLAKLKRSKSLKLMRKIKYIGDHQSGDNSKCTKVCENNSPIIIKTKLADVNGIERTVFGIMDKTSSEQLQEYRYTVSKLDTVIENIIKNEAKGMGDDLVEGKDLRNAILVKILETLKQTKLVQKILTHHENARISSQLLVLTMEQNCHSDFSNSTAKPPKPHSTTTSTSSETEVYNKTTDNYSSVTTSYYSSTASGTTASLEPVHPYTHTKKTIKPSSLQPTQTMIHTTEAVSVSSEEPPQTNNHTTHTRPSSAVTLTQVNTETSPGASSSFSETTETRPEPQESTTSSSFRPTESTTKTSRPHASTPVKPTEINADNTTQTTPWKPAVITTQTTEAGPTSEPHPTDRTTHKHTEQTTSYTLIPEHTSTTSTDTESTTEPKSTDITTHTTESDFTDRTTDKPTEQTTSDTLIPEHTSTTSTDTESTTEPKSTDITTHTTESDFTGTTDKPTEHTTSDTWVPEHTTTPSTDTESTTEPKSTDITTHTTESDFTGTTDKPTEHTTSDTLVPEHTTTPSTDTESTTEPKSTDITTHTTGSDFTGTTDKPTEQTTSDTLIPEHTSTTSTDTESTTEPKSTDITTHTTETDFTDRTTDKHTEHTTSDTLVPEHTTTPSTDSGSTTASYSTASSTETTNFDVSTSETTTNNNVTDVTSAPKGSTTLQPNFTTEINPTDSVHTVTTYDPTDGSSVPIAPALCANKDSIRGNLGESKAFKCPHVGIFRDPLDCHSYYICTRKIIQTEKCQNCAGKLYSITPLHQTCRHGKYFSSSFWKCVKAKPVTCTEKESTKYENFKHSQFI